MNMRKINLKPEDEKHTERMEIRMKKRVMTALDLWAEEKMCTRGEAVRRLIESGLNQATKARP